MASGFYGFQKFAYSQGLRIGDVMGAWLQFILSAPRSGAAVHDCR